MIRGVLWRLPLLLWWVGLVVCLLAAGGMTAAASSGMQLAGPNKLSAKPKPVSGVHKKQGATQPDTSGAEKAPAPPRTREEPQAPPVHVAPEASGGLEGIICYRGTYAYLLAVPDGWDNDPVAARRLGLCALLLPTGLGFDDAPAVMYPQMHARVGGETQEEAAQLQAEVTLRDFRKKPGGQQLSLRAGEPVVNSGGLVFAMRFFDNGPHPNVAEAAAYHAGENAVFNLVLSAFDAEGLAEYLPSLRRALDGVMPLRLASMPPEPVEQP